jgi:hypothetical protein
MRFGGGPRERAIMSLTGEMAGGVPDELRGAIKAFHDDDGSLPESQLLLRETVRVLSLLIRAAVIQEDGSLQGETAERMGMRLLPWRATCNRVLDLLAEACLHPPAAAARAELKRIVCRGWRIQPPVLPRADVHANAHARDSPHSPPPRALACPQ